MVYRGREFACTSGGGGPTEADEKESESATLCFLATAHELYGNEKGLVHERQKRVWAWKWQSENSGTKCSVVSTGCFERIPPRAPVLVKLVHDPVVRE